MKRHPWFWILGVLFLLWMIGRISNGGPSPSATDANSTCKVSDIVIDKLRARTESTGYTRITGRLTNNCSQAVGAQIKIAVYNRAGDILRVDEMWPASISNIPANSEFPFEWLDNVEGFHKFNASVIEVKTWHPR